jgi:hypothetical protein
MQKMQHLAFRSRAFCPFQHRAKPRKLDMVMMALQVSL